MLEIGIFFYAYTVTASGDVIVFKHAISRTFGMYEIGTRYLEITTQDFFHEILDVSGHRITYTDKR